MLETVLVVHCIYIVTLVSEGRIWHFTKWQILPSKTEVTKEWLSSTLIDPKKQEILLTFRGVWWSGAYPGFPIQDIQIAKSSLSKKIDYT